MLSRLYPLGAGVVIENRPRKPGETVDLTIELSLRREIRVIPRGLVCEEHTIKL